MKKIIIIFISIVVIFFAGIIYMIINDNQNTKNGIKNIEDHTKIENITYVNNYQDHYLITNKEYLYLLDLEYNEILKISLDKVKPIEENDDIVYLDKEILYLRSTKKNNTVVLQYYDIYNYELVKEITLGGK